MPQLFLDGWISMYPGDGEMTFQLPDGTTWASFSFSVRNPDDENHIEFTGTVVPESAVENAPNVAVISWTNSHGSSIDVDYNIEPYEGTPPEGGVGGLGGLG